MTAPQPKLKSEEILEKYLVLTRVAVIEDKFQLARDLRDIKKILGKNAVAEDYVHYGILASWNFDLTEARVGFNNALARLKNSDVYHNYGWALDRLSKFEEAAEMLKLAYEKEKSQDTKDNLIGCLILQGKIDEACVFASSDSLESVEFQKAINVLQLIIKAREEDRIDTDCLVDFVSKCLEYLNSLNINYVWDLHGSCDEYSDWISYTAQIHDEISFDRLMEINDQLGMISVDFSEFHIMDAVEVHADAMHAN